VVVVIKGFYWLSKTWTICQLLELVSLILRAYYWYPVL